MASRLKQDGVVGKLLHQMANRGGTMTTDASRFPPSRVMLRPKKAGYVTKTRSPRLGRCNVSVWHLTDKGWAAIGRSPPLPVSDTSDD